MREVRAGDPATGLIRAARKAGACQLVIGSRRRPRWSRLLNGSTVADQVLRAAGDLPVQIVNIGQPGQGQRRVAPPRTRRPATPQSLSRPWSGPADPGGARGPGAVRAGEPAPQRGRQVAMPYQPLPRCTAFVGQWTSLRANSYACDSGPKVPSLAGKRCLIATVSMESTFWRMGLEVTGAPSVISDTGHASAPRPGFELSESKLEPPRGRPGMVVRATLVDRLIAAQAPVITVIAPPGRSLDIEPDPGAIHDRTHVQLRGSANSGTGSGGRASLHLGCGAELATLLVLCQMARALHTLSSLRRVILVTRSYPCYAELFRAPSHPRAMPDAITWDVSAVRPICIRLVNRRPLEGAFSPDAAGWFGSAPLRAHP